MQAQKSSVCLQTRINGVWIESLAYALLGLCFKSNKSDPSLSTPSVVTAHLSLIQKIITKLNLRLSLKQLGELDNFLGIEIKHLNDGSLLLSQAKYHLGSARKGSYDSPREFHSDGKKAIANFPSMGRLCG